MIAGLAAAADLISSWSEEEDEEEEEGSQLRRMRDRLAQNLEVPRTVLWIFNSESEKLFETDQDSIKVI